MNRLRINVLAGAAFAALAVLAIIAGCTSKMVLPARAPAALSAPTLPPELATNLSPALKPGPNDARIAYVTARLLENFHYSQQPFDTEISEKFFDAYLDSLDPRHENFLQSDLDEFAPYRTNLAVLTLGTNLAPAYVIYQRYLERIRQHADYVNELLSEDKFKFNTDEQVVLDRRHAPWPRDLDEARQLWSLRLRYEYLQEKLSREISPTNSAVIIPLSKTNAIDIRDSLARHYRWNLHQATNWNSTDVLQAYLNALAHAYDPHSDYFNPEHAQDFSISMSLSLFGIGAQLTEDDGYCTISSLVPGGPAEKSKQLHEKDRIVAVAQGGQPFVDVVDMELGRVVQLIRGSKGSQVRLMISPAEDRAARREVTLVRDEIKLEDQEAKAQLIEWTDARGGTNRIGIIDLPSFYATIDLPGNSDHPAAKSTTADVARLIRKLKAENVSGIILDLRSNPGGSLEEAVRFTGLFIKNGPVVLARSPDGTVNVDSDPDGSQLYDGPLVVLVNRFSASASEIAAAALQDYGRALVVGDVSTFGKGTVQNLNPLRPWVWPTPAVTNDPGTVKITIRKFYRISGASTQLKGVMPDIVLPDVLSYSTQFGESALENPLPWDVITNVNYTKLDLVQPYLADLRSRSAERLATNQDFAYVHQDIDDYLKRQSDKTASLNEHKRLEERQENDARQKARDAERAARKAPDVKIYNLTVKLAGEPGLPPPLGETNVVTADHAPAGAASAPAANDRAMIPIGTTPMSLTTTTANTPAIDPMLDETKRILSDYISLLSANKILIANQPK